MAKAVKAQKAQKAQTVYTNSVPSRPNKVAVVIGNTISIIINAVLLYYVLRLENLSGCECVTDWRKEYLKYYSIFSMGVSVLGMALMNYYNKFTATLVTIRGLANILAIYCLFTYMRDLKDNCPCSIDDTTNKNLNKFFYVYAAIIAVLIVVSLAISFFLLMTLMFVSK